MRPETRASAQRLIDLARDPTTPAYQLRHAADTFARAMQRETVLLSLTERQLEIALHAASGQTYAEIAYAFGLTVHTVRGTLHETRRRLKLRNNTQLALWLWRHGMLEEEQD